jgi:hypothetical protein
MGTPRLDNLLTGRRALYIPCTTTYADDSASKDVMDAEESNYDRRRPCFDHAFSSVGD